MKRTSPLAAVVPAALVALTLAGCTSGSTPTDANSATTSTPTQAAAAADGRWIISHELGQTAEAGVQLLTYDPQTGEAKPFAEITGQEKRYDELSLSGDSEYYLNPGAGDPLAINVMRVGEDRQSIAPIDLRDLPDFGPTTDVDATDAYFQPNVPHTLLIPVHTDSTTTVTYAVDVEDADAGFERLGVATKVFAEGEAPIEVPKKSTLTGELTYVVNPDSIYFTPTAETDAAAAAEPEWPTYPWGAYGESDSDISAGYIFNTADGTQFAFATREDGGAVTLFPMARDAAAEQWQPAGETVSGADWAESIDWARPPVK